MNTVIVRYTPEADQADENQRLIEAVFADLEASQPDGFKYATFRLADGTFVHIAEVEDENPLGASKAFGDFQAGLGDRCAEGNGPNPQAATLVGSYRLMST